MNQDDLDTPALIVDLERLERNIARMAKRVERGGKAMRPHTKTHKTPEIARMQIDAGARGITVAKLGEAEVMADAGFEDILVANQIVGHEKVDRLIALQRRARVTVGVDSIENALPIGQRALLGGVVVPVYIEVDTGLNRAGVRSAESAVELAASIAEAPGLELTGIFTHEGHVYKTAAGGERTAACGAAAEVMRQIAAAIRSRGIGLHEVSVGSTPGAEYMANEQGITEMRPGVYVFNDVVQMRAGGAVIEDCALSVLTTIISMPDEDTAIVDAGTKALSGDRGADGNSHGVVLENPSIRFDWASEEHGHLDLRDAAAHLRVGQKLRIIPWHACASTNMHDTLYAVRGDSVEQEWVIAGRGKIR